VYTLKSDASSAAISAPLAFTPRCAVAPSTRMIGAPSPIRVNPIVVPSFEVTVARRVPSCRLEHSP